MAAKELTPPAPAVGVSMETLPDDGVTGRCRRKPPAPRPAMCARTSSGAREDSRTREDSRLWSRPPVWGGMSGTKPARRPRLSAETRGLCASSLSMEALSERLSTEREALEAAPGREGEWWRL